MLAFQAPHKKIGPEIASSSGPVPLLLRVHDIFVTFNYWYIALLPKLSRAVLYATVHFFVDPVPSKALE